MQIVASQVSLVGLWGIGLLNLLTKVVVELLDEEEAAEEDRSINGTLQTTTWDKALPIYIFSLINNAGCFVGEVSKHCILYVV